jgi:hypothetical protein
MYTDYSALSKEIVQFSGNCYLILANTAFSEPSTTPVYTPNVNIAMLHKKFGPSDNGPKEGLGLVCR